MAVQAQYPSSVVRFGGRGEKEPRKGMDFPAAAPPGLLDQPAALFFSSSNGDAAGSGGNGNPRKRGREVVAPMAQAEQTTLNGVTGLATLQPAPLVSTGLRLALEDQTHSTSLLSGDVAALLAAQRDDIDRFILAQGEQLRRVVEERRRRHYRTLLGAAEAAAVRKLREKDAEVERAARRGAELEDRLARLRAESMAWQAKALADQAAAAALHAQLQQASTAAAAPRDEPPAEDAGSAFVDPDRVEPVGRTSGSDALCRVCRTRHVSVVLLPCRHLCLCADCDAAACPVCASARTGSVLVFLS